VHVRAVRRWTATTASSFGDQREAQHARVYAYVRSSPVGTARRLTASCPRVRLDQNPAPVVELPTRVDVLSGMKISTPPLLKMRSVRLRGWTLGQVLPAVQDWPERCLLAPFQHNRPVFEGRKKCHQDDVRSYCGAGRVQQRGDRHNDQRPFEQQRGPNIISTATSKRHINPWPTERSPHVAVVCRNNTTKRP
jgi:hypothetical protein